VPFQRVFQAAFSLGEKPLWRPAFGVHRLSFRRSILLDSSVNNANWLRTHVLVRRMSAKRAAHLFCEAAGETR
jgi:hypothetical protein